MKILLRNSPIVFLSHSHFNWFSMWLWCIIFLILDVSFLVKISLTWGQWLWWHCLNILENNIVCKCVTGVSDGCCGNVDAVKTWLHDYTQVQAESARFSNTILHLILLDATDWAAVVQSDFIIHLDLINIMKAVIRCPVWPGEQVQCHTMLPQIWCPGSEYNFLIMSL